MKRKAALFIILVTLIFALVACKTQANERNIIYEGKALKIERKGAITRIYDLAGNAEYTFKKCRIRTRKNQAEPVQQATTTNTTDTIDIKTVHGIIIVTTADGETLYIK